MEKSHINEEEFVDKLSAEKQEEEELFRANISTMDSKGNRHWVYAKKPKGKYTNYRTYVSWVLLAIFVITPFIKLPNGNPLFKFDILNREFILFGYPFYTSDFFLLAIGMITTMVCIVLFTAVYGRIFCGWICPQTIFLEMVFRKIEYAIDGDRAKQIRLDKQEWNSEKIRKRLLKWSIYLIISIIMANLLVSYVFGADEMLKMIKEGPFNHLTTFIVVMCFAAGAFFVYSWFREQACTLVCPYGRFQGVLIDKKTIIVAYDYRRGEGKSGRARFRKGEDREALGKGDCIDCNQCVVVCPTGIDIRNGTQLECVNCTVCIDACDEVMEKINLPKGLIRYASEENIAKGEKFKFTTRMYFYTGILFVLLTAITLFFMNRSEIEAKFLREPGSIYTTEGEYIINRYQFTLTNKTNKDKEIHLKDKTHPNAVISKIRVIEKISKHEVPKIPINDDKIDIEKGNIRQGTFELKIPKNDLKSYRERVILEITDEDGNIIDEYKTSFLGPYI